MAAAGITTYFKQTDINLDIFYGKLKTLPKVKRINIDKDFNTKLLHNLTPN